MTNYLKNKYSTESELALMGHLIQLGLMAGNKEEAIFILDYICQVLGVKTDEVNGESIYERAMAYCDEGTKVAGISTSRIMGEDRVINIVLKTKDEEVDFASEEGCFCYVYNIDDDWCSEYGYSFFEKEFGLPYYHRIA